MKNLMAIDDSGITVERYNDTIDLSLAEDRDYAIMLVREIGVPCIGEHGINDPTIYEAAAIKLLESEIIDCQGYALAEAIELAEANQKFDLANTLYGMMKDLGQQYQDVREIERNDFSDHMQAIQEKLFEHPRLH